MDDHASLLALLLLAASLLLDSPGSKSRGWRRGLSLLVLLAVVPLLFVDIHLPISRAVDQAITLAILALLTVGAGLAIRRWRRDRRSTATEPEC